jgi:acyl-CoA thioesterase I
MVMKANMQGQREHFKRRQMVLWTAGLLLMTAPLSGQSASARKVLILGDSLSAEYGLARGAGWVALLEARLTQQGVAAQVINASISGETTSGGRTRLPALLQQQRPTHVVIELGGNDALRGFPVRSTQDNLEAMTKAAQAAGAKVLLVGMQVPPNYGKRYAEDFAAVFARVAQERKVALVPFLLKGVADRADARDWFQADGIHPLAKAHPVMLDNVWVGLKPLL